MNQELPFKRKSEFQSIGEILPAYAERLLARAGRPIEISEQHWNKLTEQERRDMEWVYNNL